MNSLVDLLTSIGAYFVNALVYPFQSLLPVWGLLSVSIISGILFLLIYGKVSSQSAIRKAKRSIHSALLEAVLYRQDLPTSLKAQAKMLWYGFVYFMIAVPPIIILLIPCLTILAQLELRYGTRPLKVGESSLLSVYVHDKKLLNDIILTHDQGLEVTDPVHIQESGEIIWRIDPKQAGVHNITLSLPAKSLTLQQNIPVDVEQSKIAPFSYQSWWMRFLYPSPLDLKAGQGVIREVQLSYPERSIKIFGYSLHWLVIFALVSILTGLVASKLFHVEI